MALIVVYVGGIHGVSVSQNILESLSFWQIWFNDPAEISIEIKRRHQIKSTKRKAIQVYWTSAAQYSATFRNRPVSETSQTGP